MRNAESKQKRPRDSKTEPRSVEKNAQGLPDTLADDRNRKEGEALGKDARCRRSMDKRFNSAEGYARFAIDAAHDIFDGAALKPFVVLGQIDDRVLRSATHDLRREMWEAHRRSVGGKIPAAVTEGS